MSIPRFAKNFLVRIKCTQFTFQFEQDSFCLILRYQQIIKMIVMRAGLYLDNKLCQRIKFLWKIHLGIKRLMLRERRINFYTSSKCGLNNLNYCLQRHLNFSKFAFVWQSQLLANVFGPQCIGWGGLEDHTI